jgi:hypothetical protein
LDGAARLTEGRGLSAYFRRSEIEKTTDSCSVCEEEVNFFGMVHHMRTTHPDEFPAWLLWAAGVVLAFALPVAGMMFFFVFYGPTNGILVILMFVVVIMIAEIVVGRVGKSWEMKVSERWKAAHPVSSRTKSKRARKN